jgi:hypothetical protein
MNEKRLVPTLHDNFFEKMTNFTYKNLTFNIKISLYGFILIALNY